MAGTPLLAAPAWRPAAPIPLTSIRLEFRPDAPAAPDAAAGPDVAAMARALLPLRADGTRYRGYSEVVEHLAAPAIFENRSVYRLTGADLTGGDPHLAFARGRFFDGVDVGGPAGHEYAAAQLGIRAELPLRAAIKDPCDPGARPAAIAVSALTLRHDRAANTASFPLHWRDPARVGHAGGMYQVIPVGIFQPSGEAPWNEANDFDLWRGMLREYAEELLGAAEDHGSETAPIDYGRWPLARQMTDALHDGRIRAYCLGLGADPLTFALDLLAVVVIDAPLYDDLFGDLVPTTPKARYSSPVPSTSRLSRNCSPGTRCRPRAPPSSPWPSATRRPCSAVTGKPSRALPAPLAPLRQVRPLGAERGVLPVPRVHPRGVRQPAEDLRDHAVVQRDEALRVLLRVADAAGEQAVPGEQVRLGPVRLVAQRDAARACDRPGGSPTARCRRTESCRRPRRVRRTAPGCPARPPGARPWPRRSRR